MTPPAGPRQPGRAVGLPQYVWDTRLRNYVARDTGRMVKRAAIQEALGAVCDRGAETLAAIAQAGQAGTLTPRQFYEAMQREVKQLYSAAAALGKGGWAQMTPSDWGKVGRELRDEYGRLAKFAAGLADGTISEAQAIARARLYADSAYKQYWRTWSEQQIALGNDEERWVTVGDERVCPICSELEGRGWQPLGSLPQPGDPHAGCRCGKQFRAAKVVQPARQPQPRRTVIGAVPPGPPPRKPGAEAARARLTALTLESLALAEELRNPISLHYGPGPHPDGSPQAVHAGGAGATDSRAVAAKLTAAGIDGLESGNCWVMAAATYEALRQSGQQPAILDWSGHVDAATRTPDGGWLAHTVNGPVPFSAHPMTKLKRMREPWRVHRNPDAMIATLIGEDGVLPPRQQRAVSGNLRKASKIVGASWQIPEAMALHQGPGPHSSGSPQSVHAGGANPPAKPRATVGQMAFDFSDEERNGLAPERLPGKQGKLEALAKEGRKAVGPRMQGGIFGAHLVYLGEGEKLEWVVFKADLGGSKADNEVVARDLARLLGTDIVPPATCMTVNDKDGSGVVFIDDLRTGGEIFRDTGPRAQSPFDAQEVETLLALDVVMGNTDRNYGNWGVDGKGRLWAIDHGLARWRAVDPAEMTEVNGLPLHQSGMFADFLIQQEREVGNFGAFGETYRDAYPQLQRVPPQVDYPGAEDAMVWEISPERLTRWQSITKKQFVDAIDTKRKYSLLPGSDAMYRPNTETAWRNFETLRTAGKIVLYEDH